MLLLGDECKSNRSAVFPVIFSDPQLSPMYSSFFSRMSRGLYGLITDQSGPDRSHFYPPCSSYKQQYNNKPHLYITYMPLSTTISTLDTHGPNDLCNIQESMNQREGRALSRSAYDGNHIIYI